MTSNSELSSPERKLVQLTLWKTVCRFIKKQKTEVPYDLTIPLLGMYLDKTDLKRYMHLCVHGSIIYNSQDIEGS